MDTDDTEIKKEPPESTDSAGFESVPERRKTRRDENGSRKRYKPP